MRLFHVSEDGGIAVFKPRLPQREDMDPHTGLVWAIDEDRLFNFLTPRNCPRIACHAGPNTTDMDKRKFFSSAAQPRLLVIERKWMRAMRETTLYLYEFVEKEFTLQDDIAGYYVAKTSQMPIARHRVDDLLAELAIRHVEIRVADRLWDIADQVRASTLNWSLCRMAYAQPREFE